jgi:hypothetical protein
MAFAQAFHLKTGSSSMGLLDTKHWCEANGYDSRPYDPDEAKKAIERARLAPPRATAK